MPYLSPLEQRFKILTIFLSEDEPKTILEISRLLGYKSPQAIRKALHNLHGDGSLFRHEQIRHNGETRYLYTMSEHGKSEHELLAKQLNRMRFNGIR